jgi:hypothetical protein
MKPRIDKNLTQKLKEHAESWRNYFNTNITQYHDFYEFVKGRQWSDKEEGLLKEYNKVPLCVNKLNTLVRTLVGEQRQNTPNLQVIPDKQASEQTAAVREALIKTIAFRSTSKVHYQTAFAQAQIGGFSALRCYHDYENNRTFNQQILIDSFRDPTKCYWDLSATDHNKTDGSFCGFTNFMSRNAFRAKYGAKIEKKIGEQASDDLSFTWANDKGIVVNNAFEKEYKTTTLYLLENDIVAEKDEIEIIDGVAIYDGIPLGILDEREAPKYIIRWYKTAGDYVLEESIFPSEILPIPFVDCDSWYDRHGKQVCVPFVADVRDTQKYLNYLATQSAYLLKTSRYDQFLVSKENIRGEDTKAIWTNPSAQQGGLFFDKDRDGFIPQPLRPPELPASLTQQYDRAMSDLYTGTGMYASRLGDQGNEVSGKAIDSRTRQGSYSTYINFDNLNRAINTIGVLVNQMIPSIYDTNRSITLDMPDTGEKLVNLNEPMDEYGGFIENDMTKGTYEVKLKAGPSFEGQREIMFQSLNQVLQANPEVFQLIADLYVENLPAENAIELRNRLRTIVPPDIIEAGKTGQPLPKKQEGPDPQQIMAQLKAQELELKKQELELKAQKQNADIQMELEQLEKDRLEIAAKLEEQEMRYTAETGRTQADIRIAHADNLAKILTHKIQ